MKIYQSLDGRWILWTGTEKIFFDTEDEVLMAEKKLTYIEEVRQWQRDYQQMMQRAWTLQNRYGLYQNDILEEDMPGDIIPSNEQGDETRKRAFVDAFANIQSIFSAYDAGIDDNFERVT